MKLNALENALDFSFTNSNISLSNSAQIFILIGAWSRRCLNWRSRMWIRQILLSSVTFLHLQGFFIFLVTCVRQKKVRDMWWIPLVACVTCKQPSKKRREDSFGIETTQFIREW